MVEICTYVRTYDMFYCVLYGGCTVQCTYVILCVVWRVYRTVYVCYTVYKSAGFTVRPTCPMYGGVSVYMFCAGFTVGYCTALL